MLQIERGVATRWARVLSTRSFRALWIGRTVSWFGNAVAPVALAFAVLDITKSTTALGAVVAARSVPHLALVLVGGSLADRANRPLLLKGEHT